MESIEDICWYQLIVRFIFKNFGNSPQLLPGEHLPIFYLYKILKLLYLILLLHTQKSLNKNYLFSKPTSESFVSEVCSSSSSLTTDSCGTRAMSGDFSLQSVLVSSTELSSSSVSTSSGRLELLHKRQVGIKIERIGYFLVFRSSEYSLWNWMLI